MILTIKDGATFDYITVLSKHPAFKEKYGEKVDISTRYVYMGLSDIADWVNNKVNEECLFEVD